MPLANKLCRVVTYLEVFLLLKPWFFQRVVLQDQVANEKHISTVTMPMAFKRSKVMTYHEDLRIKKSHDLKNTQSCGVTWHIKCIISSLLIRTMTTKNSKVMTYRGKFPPIRPHKLFSTLSHDFTWQLKTLNLHYHNAYVTKLARVVTWNGS